MAITVDLELISLLQWHR